MGVWAIVPVKDPQAAKSRLGPSCGLAERRALQRSMLAHVLAVLRGCDDVERVVTVGPGPACDWPELGSGVNGTLRLARERVPGRALVVNGDLPLLRREEVAQALRHDGPLLFASWDGEGTNGFLLPPAVPLLASYGPGSLARHVALYRAIGVEARPFRAQGLAADIDRPADASRAVRIGVGPALAGRLARAAFVPDARRRLWSAADGAAGRFGLETSAATAVLDPLEIVHPDLRAAAVALAIRGARRRGARTIVTAAGTGAIWLTAWGFAPDREGRLRLDLPPRPAPSPNGQHPAAGRPPAAARRRGRRSGGA